MVPDQLSVQSPGLEEATGLQEEVPLAGIRVVELAQMVAGPSAGLLLADYGADVIKIEPPDGDGCRQLRSRAAADLPDSPVFVAYNRNKRLIRLDLRAAGDLAVARELIAQADVVIEASRPGVMERLGLGANRVLADHPRVIYASISGFGWTGTGSTKPGVDLIVQAESGIMSTTGYPNEPMKVGFTIVDAACGHALCHGILAALFRREKTGKGGIVRSSLYAVALHLQSGPLTEFLMTGQQTPRSGNSAPLTAPADVLRCAQGSIVVSAYLQPHWIRFVRTLGADALLIDSRFADSAKRVAHRDELIPLLETYLATRTAAEWHAALQSEGLLVGQVKDYPQVVSDPLTAECALIERIGDEYGIRNPIHLEGTTKLPLWKRAPLAK